MAVLSLPADLEVLELQGNQSIKGTSLRLDRGFVGNAAGDVLRSKVGFSRLLGGSGNDTIHLSSMGLDTVSGGPGQDRFMLSGTPSAVGTEAGGKPGLAHTITDFTPGQDTLVLSATVHGPEVVQLRTVLRTFDPAGKRDDAPKGSGPALVVNSKAGLVRYDRDDRGRTPDRLLVKLPTGTKLTAKEIEIR